MLRSWRLPVLAALLNVCLGAGVAAAQTVVVRKAPPGTRVEVVVNAAAVASSDVDANGDAKVGFDLAAAAGKPEIDANVYVDTCDTVRRVVIVERDRLPPPPEAGCTRRQISGVFWVRKVNTLVIDLGGANPTLLLIKGSYSLDPDAPARSWTPSMTGLSVFGGGGFGTLRDARALACGNVTPCGGHDSGLGYTAGATYWFGRFIGAEGSYLKPGKVTANGSGDGYSFASSLDPQMFTIVGKVGVPIGPVKLYGLVGTNYHQATSTTVQTIDGATQTLEFQTEGWNVLFGGGLDAWIASRVALYAEAGLAGIKGKAVGGGEAQIDDRLRFILIGVRVRLGR
jgi:outer membrane protein with beta-barrel domain